MADVRQAVLEFDAAVQVPWRPLLGSGVSGRAAEPARTMRPATPARGAGRGSVPRGVPVRRDPAAPAGRPVASRTVSPRAVRGGCATRRRQTDPRLRLTRRGRWFVATLALGGAVAFGSWIGPILSGAGGEGLRLAGESSVVVQRGDTVWSIGAEVAGVDEDVRAVVDAIEELNGLEGSVVVPGQVLQLP